MKKRATKPTDPEIANMLAAAMLLVAIIALFVR